MDAKYSAYDKYNKLGDSDFSWQKDCSESIRNQQNVILSSPTGSGKTKVFLEWANNQQGRPIIITAPIKALSNQRYRELLAEGYTTGLETGDIKNVPDNCDFICCTQEIYTNKYSELENVTLIMDEFHYIFENPDRARTYIDALHNSKAKSVLLCSATLGDMSKLTEYINRVSGRDFFAYENDSRLTSLFFEGNIDSEEIRNSLIITFSRRNIENILYSLYSSREMQDEETFENIKRLAEEDKIYNYEIIDNARKGIAGYYSALLPKEKLFIEKCFEQGMIDTVVGTDALALGVNFPVENVIFAQLAKYYDGPISKNLFEQLAGRAGRKGFFDEGHVYYCTDFAQFCESFEYDTQDLFGKILEQPNEDVSIVLNPKIKDILLNRTTIEEEAEFISRFSTIEIDANKEARRISDLIDYIRYRAFPSLVDILVDERFRDDDKNYDYSYDDYDDYDYDDYDDSDYDENEQRIINEEKELYRESLLAHMSEYLQNLPRVYFDEYTAEMNCKIFTEILCGIEPTEILRKYGMSGNFNDMLQFRKYVNSLPKKYRKGLTKINDRIRKIDETAIDEFRGSVSVEEISEELEQDGKLDGRSVMQVLKAQENLQRMNERAKIIEEQLIIAQEYGLEDY